MANLDTIISRYKIETKEAQRDLGRLTDDIKGVDKQVESSGSAITKAMNNVGKAIVGAFAISKITDFIAESIRLAAVTEGVRQAFDRLNNPALLNNLRRATRGTVSDLQLMQTAVRANNFKIPLEQLGSLLQFAQKRAVETGEAIDYMVESILVGVARQSIPIIDNLGISAVEVRKEMEKTGDMAQALANIINRDMPDANDEFLTSAERIAQTQANIENLKVEIGNNVIPVWEGLLGVVNNVVKSMETALKLPGQINWKALGSGESIWKGLNLQMLAYKNTGEDANEETEEQVRTLEGLEAQLEVLQRTLRKVEIGSAAFYDTQRLIKVVQGEIDAALGRTNKGLKETSSVFKEHGDELPDYVNAWMALIPVVAELDEGLEALRVSMAQTFDTSDLLQEAMTLVAFEGLAADAAINGWLEGLEDGIITVEQFYDMVIEKIKETREEREKLNETEDVAIQGMINLSDASGKLAQAIEGLGLANERYGIFIQGLTLAQITFAKAAAVAEAIKNAASFSKDPFTFLATIATVIATITSFIGEAQALAGSTNVPQFAKGVVDLKGPGTETSDSIHARLSKGESVITAKATRQDKALFKAANNLDLEKYIHDSYVLPALIKKERESSVNKDILEAMYRSYLSQEKGNKDRNRNNKELIGVMRRASQPRRSWRS